MTDEWANKIADAIHDEHDHPNSIDESDYARWAAEYREQKEASMKKKQKNHHNGFLPKEVDVVVYGLMAIVALVLVLLGIGVGFGIDAIIKHFAC